MMVDTLSHKTPYSTPAGGCFNAVSSPVLSSSLNWTLLGVAISRLRQDVERRRGEVPFRRYKGGACRSSL